MFLWIYERPDWEVAGCFALVFLGVTWTATLLFRRYLHRWLHNEARANEMVGFVLSSFSVFYGILVALVALAAYQNITVLSATVAEEASSLGAMYRDLGAYPQPMRGRLRDQLRDYTRYEIERDWPLLRHGIMPAEGTHRLGSYVDELLSFMPQSPAQRVLHAETLHQLSTFMELRTLRLAGAETGIPEVLWWVVGIGALLTLLLLAMLTMEMHVHLILGAALSAFLGLVIFLMAAMDHPFLGRVGVNAEPFERLFASLMLPSDAVTQSMEALIHRASKLGPPHLQGVVPVAGRAVPGLYFGPHLLNNTTDLVDELVREHGGVVSIFVRSGDQYVRVATNTRAPDGSRALGTLLDSYGPVILMIRRGEAYYGEALAVGKAYVTGYEPMKDARGNIIGIYCTAYLKP